MSLTPRYVWLKPRLSVRSRHDRRALFSRHFRHERQKGFRCRQLRVKAEMKVRWSENSKVICYPSSAGYVAVDAELDFPGFAVGVVDYLGLY